MIALSPDGRRLVYVADDQLYLRDLSALVARPIPGTDGAYSPFFSPDGETVAYFTDNNLKKVSLRGGASETVATVSNANQGIWTTAGDIVFTIAGPTGILRVPATRRARTPHAVG
jgi:sugar lactone lactonase YvrE